MDLLTGLFDRVGLQTNITTTKVITFMPGKIPTFLLDTTYRAQIDEDFRGKGKDRKVECNECCKMLAVGSLAGHLAKQHNVHQSFVMEEEQDGSLPLLLLLPRARLPARAGGSGMRDSWNVRCHFSYCHIGQCVAVAKESTISAGCVGCRSQ